MGSSRNSIAGTAATVALTGLLAACGGSGGASSHMVTRDSPHYQTDVTLCGDDPSNMDWGSVKSQLGGATPVLARLVSTWYGDFGQQQITQATEGQSAAASLTGKVFGDGVAVAAWCKTNLAGWSSS